MSYTLPEAAARLGLSVRQMKDAIRRGDLQSPGPVGALSTLSNDWLLAAEATAVTTKLRRHRQTVPPFARYEGTSAFRKYPVRVREYNTHKAGTHKAGAPEANPAA